MTPEDIAKYQAEPDSKVNDIIVQEKLSASANRLEEKIAGLETAITSPAAECKRVALASCKWTSSHGLKALIQERKLMGATRESRASQQWKGLNKIIQKQLRAERKA